MIPCIIVKKDGFHSDSALIAACIRKDPAAWEYFVKSYSRLISISIKVRLAKYGLDLPRHEEEDIKQSVLSSLWEDDKLREIKDLRSLPYWLSVVSGNTALEYLRKQHGAKAPRMVRLYGCAGAPDVEDILPSMDCGSVCRPGSGEIIIKIEEAIESLRGKEKLISKMNILFGQKYREIAESLKMPEGTVSSCMKRAKEKLRKSLKYLQ